MKQHTSLAVLFVIITTSTLLVEQSTASCGVCGTNGVACVTATDFNICYNGQPDTSVTHTCPNGGTCTALAAKCLDAANAPADCTAVTCGCAVGSSLFVCTSRTTFAQCNGSVTVANGTCPAGLTCSTARGGEFCVDECLLEGVIECDRDAPAN